MKLSPSQGTQHTPQRETHTERQDMQDMHTHKHANTHKHHKALIHNTPCIHTITHTHTHTPSYSDVVCCLLTIADVPPTENFFLEMILQANLSQDPLTNASRTSPQAPLRTKLMEKNSKQITRNKPSPYYGAGQD